MLDGGGNIIPSGDPIDMDGHGTMVAGVIAAQANNGIAISGVSPNVSLMIIKAFDGSSSTTLSVAAAIDYAIAMGADVINASYGSLGTAAYAQTGFDYQEYSAIDRARAAGILVVLPAGNGAAADAGENVGYSNDATPGGLSPYVPASYDLANIIAVAASDQNDNLASFSNYGANAVDLAAPGVGIYGAYPGGGDHANVASGTSMAAPFVTGALALMLSIDGDHTMAGLKDRLLTSVDPIDGLKSFVGSGGRLNVAAALAAKVSVDTNRLQIDPGNGGGSTGWLFLFLSAAAVLGRRRCRCVAVGLL
jgi:subtilisin family serine protease